VGYSLTGHTYEQCLFYVWGPTRGGKGLFLQILADLIGRPLAASVDFDTFTANRRGDSQNFDLAPLRPARLITASESSRANMLNAKVVKAITGNDPIYCAFKHRTHFQYTPQFKIWLASNFKVMGDPNDDALWGRLRVIHFPNSWLGREDLLLAEKLKANLPGILKWAVDGAMEWYKRLDAGQGLGRPAIIESATTDHRTQNDTIQQFIDECCTVGDGLYCKSSAFIQAYRRWCDDNGHKPLGAIRIREALERMKFHRKQVKQDGTNLGQCWLGVGLGQQKGNR
jgi:putative DNA primase/helicase